MLFNTAPGVVRGKRTASDTIESPTDAGTAERDLPQAAATVSAPSEASADEISAPAAEVPPPSADPPAPPPVLPAAKLRTAWQPEKQYATTVTAADILSPCLRRVYFRGPGSALDAKSEASAPQRQQAYLYSHLRSLSSAAQEIVEDSIAVFLTRWRGTPREDGGWQKGGQMPRQDLVRFAMFRFQDWCCESRRRAETFHRAPAEGIRLLEDEFSIAVAWEKAWGEAERVIYRAVHYFHSEFVGPCLSRPMRNNPHLLIKEILPLPQRSPHDKPRVFQHSLRIATERLGSEEVVTFDVPYRMHLLFEGRDGRHRLFQWKIGRVPGPARRGRLRERIESVARPAPSPPDERRRDPMSRLHAEFGILLLAAKAVHGIDVDDIDPAAIYLAHEGASLAERTVQISREAAVQAAEDEMAAHYLRFRRSGDREIASAADFPVVSDPVICESCSFQTICKDKPRARLMPS